MPVSRAAAPLTLCLVLACATPGAGPAPASAGAGSAGLTANRAHGADFYVTQDGAFAPAAVVDGTLVFQLKARPFQIGTNSRQMNICLTQVPAPEIRTDPKGFKASCLSGAMQAAIEPDGAELFVYGGRKWSDGNTVLQPGGFRRAEPLPGYAHAYQVDGLAFVEEEKLTLAAFRGTLHGHVVVYRQPERRPRT